MLQNLKTSGIYILYFEKDDYLYYIGKSIHVWDRYIDHLYYLKKQQHHNYKLQNLYNKYRENPTIYLLEESLDDLDKKEIYWIELFDSFKNGLNCTNGGEGAGFGEGSPSALYDNYTYTTIFFMLADYSYRYIDISNELGVSINTVSSIAVGDSHKYLQVLYPDKWELILNRHKRRSCKLTDEIYDKIFFELVNTSEKYWRIAEKYNVTETIVEEIGAGTTQRNYLEQKYPNEYKILLNKKGNRRCGSQSGKEYPAVISPNGVVYNNIINATQFSKEMGLHQGHFAELLNKKIKSHKGWKLFTVS